MSAHQPKTAYIFPGYAERASAYETVRKIFARKGYRAVVVRIHWRYKTFSSYLHEFFAQYENPDEEPVVLFGFSLGAVLALLLATVLKPEHLYLCSLSPFFRENLRAQKRSTQRSLGEKKWEELQSLSLSELARCVTCPVDLCVGALEIGAMKRQAGAAHRQMNRSTLHIIPGAMHDIRSGKYPAALWHIIR
jgi:hypothetical protein